MVPAVFAGGTRVEVVTRGPSPLASVHVDHTLSVQRTHVRLARHAARCSGSGDLLQPRTCISHTAQGYGARAARQRGTKRGGLPMFAYLTYLAYHRSDCYCGRRIVVWRLRMSPHGQLFGRSPRSQQPCRPRSVASARGHLHAMSWRGVRRLRRNCSTSIAVLCLSPPFESSDQPYRPVLCLSAGTTANGLRTFCRR